MDENHPCGADAKCKKRWSIWKKLVVLPLLPIGLLVSLCVYVFVDEVTSPPRFIDGRIDTAPMRAAPILIFFIFVAYGCYLILLALIRLIGLIKTEARK